MLVRGPEVEITLYDAFFGDTLLIFGNRVVVFNIKKGEYTIID